MDNIVVKIEPMEAEEWSPKAVKQEIDEQKIETVKQEIKNEIDIGPTAELNYVDGICRLPTVKSESDDKNFEVPVTASIEDKVAESRSESDKAQDDGEEWAESKQQLAAKSIKTVRRKLKKRDRIEIENRNLIRLVEDKDDRKYICSLCNRSYKSKYSVTYHIFKCHTYKCAFCSKTFNISHRLNKHMEIHKNKSTNVPFGNDETQILTENQAICIEEEKSPKCALCFKLKDNLTHGIINTYRCSLCFKSFSSKYYLTNHMKIHEDCSLECSYCSKCFKTKINLNAHERLHKGTYTCEYCSKKFIFKSNFTRHVAAHDAKIKKHKYKIRPKRSVKRKSRTKHTKTHLPDESSEKKVSFDSPSVPNEKAKESFECFVCNRPYATEQLLADHMKFHVKICSLTCVSDKISFAGDVSKCYTVKKPHQCSVCEKRFSTKSNLSEHMKMHPGNKT